MGHFNGKITAPVNTDDIATVLNVNTHDVGSLCMSSKINGWAKFKPLNIDQSADISDSQRASINHGLQPPAIYTNKDELVSALIEGQGAWIYSRPSISCMKRITDFVGYDHNAKSPFGYLPATIERILQQGSDFIIPAYSPPSSNDGSILNMGDFANSTNNFKDWYFSILLYYDNNPTTRYWIASANEPLSSGEGVGDWQVNFGTVINNNSYQGKYTAVPFISTYKWIANGNAPLTFRACGIGSNTSDVTLLSSAALFNISVRGYFKDTNINVFTYTVTIQNTYNTSRGFANVRIIIASDSDGSNGLAIANLNTIIVEAYSTLTIGPRNVDISYNGVASEYYRYCAIVYDGITTIKWTPMPSNDIESPNPS